MPGSLTSYLRNLDPVDLVAVVQRRLKPDALRGGRLPADLGALADMLAKPHGIREAVASLNQFLSQLLHLAAWLGPTVPVAALQTQAPGVPHEALLAGAEDLARWGLAFPVPSPGTVGWSLELPACTTAAVDMPEGFGPTGRRLLSGRSLHFLTALQRNLGLPTGPRPGKTAVADEVATALAEPDQIRRVLGEADPKATGLFDLIRSRGGRIGRRELMTTGHIRWSDPPWSERRAVLTPLDWLESRGLVLHDDSDLYSGAAVIPAEVELALRGGLLFETWQPDPPPLRPIPAPGSEHPGDPSKVLSDLQAVLDEWAQTRPPCIQKGGLGARELKKTAKCLGFTERYVSFLYALAVDLEVIGHDDGNRIVPAPVLPEWQALGSPERWRSLIGAWFGTTYWTEEDDGLVSLDKVARMPWLAHLRAAMLGELARLPAGVGTDAASLGARLFWLFPNRFHCADCAAIHVERSAEALVMLGTATASPIALLEPGRSLGHDDWAAPGTTGAAAFATEVASCTVGADLTVIVPGPPVADLGSALGRFADLTASSPARIYKVSEASVRRALDAGMGDSEILGVLERHATTGVPQNVAYLIEDVARRHGHLVVGAAGLYVRSEDPALLAAAMADRRLASLGPRLIAPTVAVLRGDNVAEMLKALRAAGYLPVAESGGVALRRKGGVATRSYDDDEEEVEVEARVWRILRPAEPTAGLDPETAATVAGGLLQGSGGAGGRKGLAAQVAPGPVLGLLDGRTVKETSEIRRLIELAADACLVVEISYVAGDGQRTTREVEPVIVDGTGVDAWCRLRHDERHFVFSRIRSARATGERYSDSEDELPPPNGDRPPLHVELPSLGIDEEDLLDLR